MREAIELAITEIVPHAGAMCLLDRALEAGAESLLAEVTISESSLFYDGNGIGGWVGIEYMAQAVAAWGGWQARLRGEAPKLGFLLGSRRYLCARPYFRVGETLRVEVHRQFAADNGLGQFDCRIEIDGVEIATAALTVFEPEDAQQFLKDSKT